MEHDGKTARINARIVAAQDPEYPIDPQWWDVHMAGQDLSGSEDQVVGAFVSVYHDWLNEQRAAKLRKDSLPAE